MKTPDPAETPRPGTVSVLSLPRREPASRRSEEPPLEEDEFRPKYLSLPLRRSRSQGRRNLTWGVLLLILSGVLFGWALYLAGPGAAYTVAGCLATATALYVIARARLFRQRNGAFLAGAMVCLLAVVLVLVQQGWMAAVRAGSSPAAAPAPAVAASRPTPAPATPVLSPALIETFKPTVAELESGAVAKVTRDFKVAIGGQSYRIRTGDIFPVAGTGPGEVRLAAGTQEVAVPPEAVEISDPRKTLTRNRREEKLEPSEPPKGAPDANVSDAAVLTQQSQREALKKYPALAIKDSPENQSFREAYQELKYGGGASFFEDPEWPLRLADMLASREGWGKPKAAAPRGEEKLAPLTDLPQDALENRPGEPAGQIMPPRQVAPAGEGLPEREVAPQSRGAREP